MLTLITTKRMVKQSLHMAWPIAGSRLLVAISNFFAMWLLAHIGHDELAAGALIFAMQITITVIMASILFALSPMIGRAYGAGDYLKIGAVVQQGWFLSALLTLPTIIILWFCKPMLLALGQEPALANIAMTYFHVYVLGMIPMFFFMTNQMLAMGIGKQRLGFSSTLFATIMLFIVSYGLGLGKWGLPNLGVAGIAYGMVASQWAGFLFSSYFIIRQDYFKPFELFRWRLTQSWNYLRQLISIGWPIVVQTGGELLSWLFSVILIGWLGQASLSAQQITNQFSILVIVPIMGFSQASSILIGQAAGAKRYDEVRHLGLVNIGIGIALMLLVMFLYLVCPRELISLYINTKDPANTNIIHLATIVFAISAFTLLFDSSRNITIGALRGLYDNRYPMYLSIIMIWFIGLPLAYTLAFPLHLGIGGLAFGNMIGFMLACLILLWRWHTRSHHLLAKAEANDQAAAR